MQEIPETRVNKIAPLIALFIKAPTIKPAKADITIIISDTTVLNLFISFTPVLPDINASVDLHIKGQQFKDILFNINAVIDLSEP